MDNPKKEAGSLKAPMFGLSPQAVAQANAAAQVGHIKYGMYNYRDVPVCSSTYIAAIRRHLDLYEDGFDYEKDTGRYELAFIMAGAACLMDAHITGNVEDDRNKTFTMRGVQNTCAALVNTFKKKWESMNE